MNRSDEINMNPVEGIVYLTSGNSVTLTARYDVRTNCDFVRNLFGRFNTDGADKQSTQTEEIAEKDNKELDEFLNSFPIKEKGGDSV